MLYCTKNPAGAAALALRYGRMIRIGISGWTYAPWRGAFYPGGLRQAEELRFASSAFSTIEINGTFYRLQSPASFAAWAETVPEDFVFSVKGSRYITHVRRLREPTQLLANFLASGVLALGRHLGPFLWQLPPNFQFDPPRLAEFLAALPQDTDQAASLARKHDSRLPARAVLKSPHPGALRHAMEIRHESFRTPEFIALLRSHGVALVCADTPEWPRLGDATADFIYARLHGAASLYASGYDEAALHAWAARIKIWASGGTPDDLDQAGPHAARHRRDVFVYFDNDLKIRAPRDAARLRALLQV